MSLSRRGFLSLLGKASLGAGIIYSFPSIIVPKNIEIIQTINLITKQEIWPKLIEDYFFLESPLLARIRKYPTVGMSEELLWKNQLEYES